MNTNRFRQLLESHMGNVKPLLVEQTKVGDTLGPIDCYKLLDIRKMDSSVPSIEIGKSRVESITQEEPGLWNIVIEDLNPPPFPDSAISEVQSVYQLDIVPLSRFFKSQLNSENPVDSKEMVVLTYDPMGQKHYCKAQSDTDQANIIAVNPASGG